MNLSSVLGSAAPWQVRELTRLDQAVRTSLPLAVRVGVVGVARGVGTSVTAGLAASVLAARGHRVLAVNSSGPGTSLLWHVGQRPTAASTPDEDERRATAATFADVTAGLPRALSGVYCLDLADSQETRWRQSVAPIGRFFDYTITDWGTRDGASLGAATRTSALVCVVAPGDRPAVQQAVDLAGATRDAGATPMVVVTDPTNSQNPAMAEICDRLPFPGVRIAHDKAHGGERPVSSRDLSARTRMSGLRLAAAIVGVAGAPATEGPSR